jgi:hypothetical protein
MVLLFLTLRNVQFTFLTIPSSSSSFSPWTTTDPPIITTPSTTQRPFAAIVANEIYKEEEEEEEEEEDHDVEFHPHVLPNVTWDVLLNYPSPLKDKTVPWHTRNTPRYWWDLDQNLTTTTAANSTTTRRPRPPPAMLLLTKYGWNQRNQWHGRTMLRSKRQRELFQGLLQHEWFHPTLWEDVRSGRRVMDPTLRYYIFLDLETCADKNYPNYLQRKHNEDKVGGRGMKGGTDHVNAIQDALQSPFFQNTTSSTSWNRIIIWDCNTYSGKYREKQFWRRRYNQDRRLVLASLTAHERDILVDHDIGLPPPACNPCHLTRHELRNILRTDCDPIAVNDSVNRDDSSKSRVLNSSLPFSNEQQQPYLLTFTGNFRSQTRQALQQLHNNGHDILIVPPTDAMQYMNESNLTASFQKMAKLSKFSAVPRGDNLFSYRFTEVLSCGSIPVVYADGWVFPFHPILVDPRDYAIIIPEDQVNQSRAMLSQISPATQCRMRRRGMQVYQRYLKGGMENVRGIVETLELMHHNNHHHHHHVVKRQQENTMP